MKYDIQPHHDQPLELYTAVDEPHEQPQSSAGLLRLVEILKRRWLTIVLLFPLMVGPALAGIWRSVKVEYTATAQIEVRPNPGYVLYPSDDRYGGSLDSMLNTQAQLMISQRVLNAAVADLKLRKAPLDLLNAPDELSAIRRVVGASPIRGSHIVQLEVNQPSVESGKLIAQAILDAYLRYSEAAEQQKEEQMLQEVENLRRGLKTAVEMKRGEINARAQIANATDAEMLDLLRQSRERFSEDIRKELEAAATNVIRLEQRLKQVEAGVLPEAAPQGDLARLSEAIENDPMVHSLRQRMVAHAEHLARLKQAGLTEEAKQVRDARENHERLKAELEKERIRAAEEIEKGQDALAKRLVDVVKKGIQSQLQEAMGVRDGLAKEVARIKAECDDLGKASVQISALKAELEVLEKELDVATQRVQMLQTERRRPSRILVASEPEVRPGGVRDKRFKLVVVAFCGALFAAFAVAFVKDLVDPRLHAPQQVEEGLGLRLLGLVPSIADLKNGRITEGEFAESYRLVRACLAVPGQNGSSPKSILATSAQACEGKTSLAVSLAASLAEAGNRVLLVDGDIQGPQIERVLKLNAAYTLKEVLAGEVPLLQAVVHSGMAHLDVLVTRLDSGSARGVLNTRSASALIREAASQYDYVVVDSPPALGAADAVVWAEAVDGVILSSLAGQSNSHAIRVACQRLRAVGARILGTVMCNLSVKRGYYSYSTSGMAVHSGHPSRGQDGQRTPPHVQLPVVEIHPSEPGSKSE